ncbi:MAG: UDP-N-acetylglucosamine 2-epimerase (non-hydrolyzing) [Flavobacteriales bacterium]|nr:UDP-N-acetylglucosamine 2-epimerase (non-hydrolyzing) [Flavobacteriales bacterium]
MTAKKKVIVVVGTRPNFIKVTQFEKEFEKYSDSIEYILVHTNQHYDDDMSRIFFEQLKLKKPEYLNIQPKGAAAYIGEVIIKLEECFQRHQPDGVVVVGDVNSTMAASIAANKLGLLLFHLESGLRSFDRTMPEEINREITDLLADHFFVTEESGRKNLLKEGKDEDRIHFVGNTMIDTMVAFEEAIAEEEILSSLELTSKQFVLVTLHRPSNVDTKESLNLIIDLFKRISIKNKIVIPLHHRTKRNLEKFGLLNDFESIPNLIITKSLSYLAFQKLVINSRYVLTDSGGIQEETTYKQVPCLTLRDNTERPSTIDIGTNTLLPLDYKAIEEKINEIETGVYKTGQTPPLWDGKSTSRIVDIIARLV